MMKYIFFTGATGGLGSRCVKLISEQGGYTIFAAGTNDKKLKAIGELPGVIPIKLDITKDESIIEAHKIVGNYTHALWAVINFAGLTAFCSMVEGECISKTEKLFDVNVMGMVRINRIFFDMVYTGKGRIINCSSEAGWMTSQPFAAPYFLSKHAVEAYSDSLRRELMYLGIPVVKIQPGSFKTDLTKEIYDSFENTLKDTAYYKKILTGMRPLMVNELKHNNNHDKLARTVLSAIKAKHPRIRYRVGTGKLLALLEILPEVGVDRVYKLFFNKY